MKNYMLLFIIGSAETSIHNLVTPCMYMYIELSILMTGKREKKICPAYFCEE